ncbi:MAG: RNA polymerase factor sigma-54 [Oceanospirillaceae bacterium]|nr:RNA polymerase factor sigma-54 [Oceanospirillaceae bacterium]
MKQSLQLKIGQSLTMTPQLQQAIRLLQLSTLELQTEIQNALDSNPLLEVVDEDESESSANALSDDRASNSDTHSNSENGTAEPSAQDTSENFDTTEWDDPSDSNVTDSQWDEEIPEDLSTDSSWDDTYQTSTSTSSAASEDDWTPGDNDTQQETLQDYLSWQLNLTRMSNIDRFVAETIIDSVDSDGYLTTDCGDILLQCQEQFPDEFLEYEMDEVEAVLHRVQQFDPVGVAARDLSECLTVQLKQLPPETPFRPEALRLCRDYLALLGNRDYKSIMRRMRIKEDSLQAVIELIQTLNPRPGASVIENAAEYVIPDVLVRKVKGDWVVSLNSEVSPELRINEQYASLIKRADTSAQNQFLRDNLQEARWFLKSLQSRNETLLKVSSQIVAKQIDFLENGEEGMKPLVLHDIAEAVEMHESTISRVTTQKYMHTPRGVFELKYFFSSHVSTVDGGSASSTAIRAVIRKLVDDEESRKPLSDSKIAKILEEQGFNVARRTIAKYREVLGIPPSNERKRLV